MTYVQSEPVKLGPVIPSKIVGQHVRMIEVALSHGNRAMAIRAVNRAFETAAEEAITLTGSDSVALILNTKTTNALSDWCDVQKISELIQMTPDQLVMIDNFSWRTVEIIQEALAKHGFELAKTTVDHSPENW